MKKVYFKRTLAALLVLTMVLAPLTGCKKGEATGEQNGDGYVYVPNYVELPDEITDMYNSCVIGDTIYFTCNVPVYLDGTIVPQDVLEEYWAAQSEYYTKYYGDSVVTYATSSSGTDIAVEDDATAETLDEPETPALPEEDPPVLEYTYEYRLYSIKVDGSDLRYLEGYEPLKAEGEYSYANIRTITSDAQGNLWLLENISETIYDLPEDFDPETGNMWDYYVKDSNTYYARIIGETGAALETICLNDYIENVDEMQYFYLYQFAVDGEGNIYFNDESNSTLYVIGSDGTQKAKLTFDGWVNGYITLRDGTVAVAAYDYNEGKSMIKTVDLAAGDWGEAIECSTNVYNLLPGGDSYDFCFNNGSSLYGFDIETGTETKIITWINNDIDGNSLQFCSVKENGDIFVISNDYSSNSVRYEVANLVKTPASEVKQKTAISLATFYLDYYLRAEILKFNKTNPDYRIEVRDYSEYNTSDDYTAGVTKLNTEIISGNIPDIIATNQLPYKQYAAKGLLEDLYTFIDNDSELSRDDLFESIFAAIEEGGKLYTVASNFGIISMIGKTSVLGSEPGWTMSEFQEIIKANPDADCPLGMGMNRESILSSLFYYNMESYVDWITGECRFDTDDFKSLLEFAKSFPSYEDMDYENMEWLNDSQLIAEGRMIASFFYLYDFYNYQYYKALYGGDDVVFKGLPSEDGGGNAASVEGGLAMTTSCKNKEAAWSFMRTVLTEEYQENMWGFPTNKNVFDKKLAEAMKQEYDVNGDPISRGGMSDGYVEVNFYALTQAEADQILSIIDSISHVANYDTSLTEIINEETSAYFAGEKGVDETARLIQSRMKLYINEQR